MFYIIIVFLLSFLVFIFVIIYAFSGFTYYYLIDLQEINNKRYSLYNDYSWDWESFLILEQNISYKNIKKIKTSSISLISKTWDQNNKYIYHFIPWDFSYENAKIEILKSRYLVLSFDWLYYFLYDIVKNKKYNDRNSKEFSELNREEIHNKILEIIQGR